MNKIWFMQTVFKEKLYDYNTYRIEPLRDKTVSLIQSTATHWR